MPGASPPVSARWTVSELARLQEGFFRCLVDGDRAFEESILGTERVGAALRLNIYSNAYRLRLLEALADAYPSVHTLLGDERFQALGLAYVDAWPSQHFSIRWFGHRLSRFLAESPDYRDTPVLAEMAAFEWALRDAFDAADTPVLDLDGLRRIEPEAWAGLGMRFHPSMRRLDLAWNVPQLWSAIDSGDSPTAPACHDYPIGWVIWRRGLQTYFRSLDVDEAHALDAGANGETFGVICDGLTEWVDELNAPQRAAGMVSRWAEDGLIASVVPNAGKRFRNAKTSGCRI